MGLWDRFNALKQKSSFLACLVDYCTCGGIDSDIRGTEAISSNVGI